MLDAYSILTSLSPFVETALVSVIKSLGAMVLPGLLGMLIFIDDYFNALAVGQVVRPITGR